VTPEDVLARYRSSLVDGEDIAVRRYAGTGGARAIVQEAVVRGRPVGRGEKELVGQVVQRYRKVILLNDPAAEVPAGKVALSELLPLRTTDRLYFHGVEVAILDIDDDTRRWHGALIAMDLTVEG